MSLKAFCGGWNCNKKAMASTSKGVEEENENVGDKNEASNSPVLCCPTTVNDNEIISEILDELYLYWYM